MVKINIIATSRTIANKQFLDVYALRLVYNENDKSQNVVDIKASTGNGFIHDLFVETPVTIENKIVMSKFNFCEWTDTTAIMFLNNIVKELLSFGFNKNNFSFGSNETSAILEYCEK